MAEWERDKQTERVTVPSFSTQRLCIYTDAIAIARLKGDKLDAFGDCCEEFDHSFTLIRYFTEMRFQILNVCYAIFRVHKNYREKKNE